MKNTDAINQADYIKAMASKLARIVNERENMRSASGILPTYGYGIDQEHNDENVNRMIVQIRAELLNLRKILGLPSK